ncbi:hypothetical protein CPJCM30710_17940 [Clostridium polyendosporum]|uniref:Uncharacterized protein n=1 Tax=Clostridium polyendosporum TaxID=69208 RepID=A0A919S0N6_9CLOT|nr:hypothetical protein CPJCM30710_17940 [Clostridium polyendosporum]
MAELVPLNNNDLITRPTYFKDLYNMLDDFLEIHGYQKEV